MEQTNWCKYCLNSSGTRSTHLIRSNLTVMTSFESKNAKTRKMATEKQIHIQIAINHRRIFAAFIVMADDFHLCATEHLSVYMNMDEILIYFFSICIRLHFYFVSASTKHTIEFILFYFIFRINSAQQTYITSSWSVNKIHWTGPDNWIGRHGNATDVNRLLNVMHVYIYKYTSKYEYRWAVEHIRRVHFYNYFFLSIHSNIGFGSCIYVFHGLVVRCVKLYTLFSCNKRACYVSLLL